MANPIVDRPVVVGKIKADFRKRDAAYDTNKKTIGARATNLDRRIDPVKQRVSQQIADEANWLIGYTDDWARASDRLDRLEESLAIANQPLVQQPDGSWGAGCTEWYRKLEPTVDALNLAQQSGGFSTRPSALAFMQKLQDPDRMVSYLDSLRTSRIAATGRNNRDEFGAVLTALSQLILKPQLRTFLEDNYAALQFKVSRDLETRYTTYLWNLQSPMTGFWGPSYAFSDGSALEVQDVSFTFHVVHYYDDYDVTDDRSVPMLPTIAATTLAISKFTYPNGWLNVNSPPDYLDHNNYDVVTLFDDCWPAVDGSTRNAIRSQLQMLIDWCFNVSIKNDQFYRPDDVTPADSFYYGARFLQVAGFWDSVTAPWGQTSGPPGSPAPKPLARTLLDTFLDNHYDDGSESASRVKQILNAVISGKPLPTYQMV